MPSSEECCDAKNDIKKWAIDVMVRRGHALRSAEMIIERMAYDEQVKLAEEIHGPIYRGPYSPY